MLFRTDTKLTYLHSNIFYCAHFLRMIMQLKKNIFFHYPDFFSNFSSNIIIFYIVLLFELCRKGNKFIRRM